jgi:hypothetical protein
MGDAVTSAAQTLRCGIVGAGGRGPRGLFRGVVLCGGDAAPDAEVLLPGTVLESHKVQNICYFFGRVPFLCCRCFFISATATLISYPGDSSAAPRLAALSPALSWSGTAALSSNPCLPLRWLVCAAFCCHLLLSLWLKKLEYRTIMMEQWTWVKKCETRIKR